MATYLQSFFIIILEIFCCKMFFEVFAGKRKNEHIWFGYLLITVLTVFDYGIALLLSGQFIIKQILVILITVIVMHLYYEINIQNSVVLVLLYQGLMLVVDNLDIALMGTFFPNAVLLLEVNQKVNIMIVILGRMLLFACVLVLRKYFGHQPSEMMSDTEWIKFLFFPVVTIAVIAAFLTNFGYVENEKQSNLLVSMAIGLAGLNIVSFYLIHDILKREMKIRENKIFEMKVKSQTAMYHSISENFEKQRKKSHEFKNQITCIEYLLGNKKYNEAEEYVRSISGNLKKELDAINTNNVIVDAILNTKYQEARDKNIVFAFKVNDLSNLKLNDTDIVVILSNLLNNAIEACEQCSDKKVIKLKFVMEEEDIIISVKNTFLKAPVQVSGGFQTTKPEEEEHGIGIRNIVETIEKYSGSYIIQNSGDEFYLSIIIPIYDI